MATREIPRENWNSFFLTFSRKHEGWLATLEVLGRDFGAKKEAHELPLEGVSISSGTNEAETIAISIGKTPENHISHMVLKPAHVWIEQTQDGADAALEIESEDDSKTLLRFRSSVPPELVDGVVLE